MSRFSPSTLVPLGPLAARALRTNEERLRARQGGWSRVELVFSPAGSIYHGYPFLFLPAFPRVAEDEVTRLSLATRLLDDSLFVADAVMDGEYEGLQLTRGTLQLQVLQLEAYSIFYELFPPSAAFWSHFRRWTNAYVDACDEERKLATPGSSWRLDEEGAKRMAAGKCGLAKVAVAGLAELSGGEGPAAALCRAIDHYYVARQMIDDLSDWRVDLERGFPSLLIARILAAVFDGDRRAMAAAPSRTARAIYLEGHAEATLGIGLRALDGAERELDGLVELPFRDLLRILRGRYESVLAEIAANRCRRGAAGAAHESLAARAGEDRWSATARSALRLLLPASDEAPRPSLLEHAFRLEALAEADRWLGGGLRDVVDAESAALLARRLRSRPHGWRYAGLRPGLPPDLWHVAQAGLALVAAGRGAEVEGDLRAWVESLPATVPPGLWALGGETWRRPVDDAVEVVALAAWLRLLEAPPGPAGAAEAVRRWLVESQCGDGAWRGAGANGPYLPTCAAVEALAAPGGPPDSLDRAWRFLAATQGASGGWGGRHGEGDLRSTALALLALGVLQERFPRPEAEERADRARRWIEDAGALAPRPGRRSRRLLSASFLSRAAIRWSGAVRLPELAAAESAMEVVA